MKIDALGYSDSVSNRAPVRSKLEAESNQEFDRIKDSGELVVYLVRNEDLKTLRRFKDSIVDRGERKSKGLKKYLLGYGDKIPIMDGKYRGKGEQIERSVQSLLSNASSKGEQKPFILGVGNAIFNRLWEKAGETDDILESCVRSESEDIKITRELKSELFKENGFGVPLLNVDVPEELETRFLGRSRESHFVRQMTMLAAENDNPVLLLGDTGTGKSLIAREIHHYSRRSEHRFCMINCGAIPSELLEAELFGCKANYPNPLSPEKPGRWEEANNGTLFLDEIGDLLLNQQVKILHALETGRIRRLGENEDRQVTARIIAATNRNLYSMVQIDQFREDLYYRLRGLVIRTIPIREYPEDIRSLADSFWKKITGGRQKALSEDLYRELLSHTWPGNTRELKCVLNNLWDLYGRKKMAIGEEIGVEHLRAVFHLERMSTSTGAVPISDKDIGLHRAMCLRHLKRVDEVVRVTEKALPSLLKNSEDRDFDYTALSLNLNEMDVFCRQPLLFHAQDTFEAIWRLKGRLAFFQGILHQAKKEAKKYWDEELAEEFPLVKRMLFKAIERLVTFS